MSSFNKTTVVPTSTSTGLPPNFEDANFSFLQASVINTGTENYQVQFALYVRVRGESTPRLKGYYQWDPTITVRG
ncbi:hypothetical protein J8M00_03725 [Pseudoalteromonas luteoviolacea]|nr:hypothetical protein [Pseudoalteromonas luteoviolacea]